MRAPATRDQADAYRFGLRRLEAALVRGDPVPLHEQLRSQRRASLVGVLLALVGLCGAAVWSVVAPQPDWRKQTVVVGSGSGALYVVGHAPDRLVPVPNLAAARLLLGAWRAVGVAGGDPGSAVPVVVRDDALAAAPRAPAPLLAGAVDVRPDGPVPASSWSVCDQVGPDGRLVGTAVLNAAASDDGAPNEGAPNERAPNKGAPNEGAPNEGATGAAPDGAAVLAGPDGVRWLVSGGRRHRTDPDDARVLAAYGLVGVPVRDASAGLLAALPEGSALVTPAVPGRGGPAPAGLPGRVGDVLVARPVGGAPQHFVVLARGVQRVPDVVAEVLRAASVARAARPVPLEVVAAAPLVDQLPVAGWPAGAPRIVGVEQAPVVCWSWVAGGPPAGTVWIGGRFPRPAGGAVVAPPGRAGWPAVAVGAGGPVRVTGPGTAAGAGPLWLISATGVGYPVADAATASALGIRAAGEAPEAVLRLLPVGPPLSLAEAVRTLDRG